MDQTRDLSGQQLHRFATLYEAPDFVKKADVGALCGDPDMPSDVYGDPVHRIFPCHSQAATWASAAFFLTKRADLKPKDAEIIDQRIQRFAEYHGITRTINALRQKVASNVKNPLTDLSDEDFALVFVEGNDKRRHYPLRNAQEVKAAADYLMKHRDSFPYQLRRDFADKVLQKAAAYGVNLGEQTSYIERQAGYGACSTKVAVNMLKDRVRAAQKGPGQMTEMQQELLKLANMFERYPSKLREPGIRVKLAAVVDAYDRATGLNNSYGEWLQRPEDVLFELTNEKMASVVKDYCATITGNIYKLADLERIRTDDVRNYVGDDFADAVAGRDNYIDSEKAAAVIPTMDRGAAELFDQLMRELGIHPIAKEASADYLGLSRDYLRYLANDFDKSKAAFLNP
jgi:hypothetical protein